MLVVIEETPHEELVRDGQNLYYDLYINFADATLGTTVEIPTISSKAKIKIIEGTQSGKILRLKGKGLPGINSYVNGDLLVNINVWTPQELNKEEKSVLESFRDSENFKPSPTGKEKSFFNRVREFFD